MVKSATRTIELLELLADHPGGLAHGEIAEHLDIPRSSITGLLRSLLAHDYVEYHAGKRTYSLGHAVLRLSRSYLRQQDLVGRARPLMMQLSSRLNEACALTIRRDNNIVVIWKVDDPVIDRPSLSMQLGQSGPIYASASGKAMLAAEGRNQINRYLGEVELVPCTSGKILSVDELRADLEQTLATGIGFSRGEMLAAITAVGVAVYGADGRPVAGLSVSFPHERATDAHIQSVISELHEVSKGLSMQLGAAA